MLLYEWVKAFHIIFIIAWMAGLLYLPRLFVYHCRAEVGSEMAATFKVMEGRLYYWIMLPAMLVSWVLGLWLIYLNQALLSQGWLHTKLLLVVFLTGAHHVQGAWFKAFRADRNRHSEGFFRVMNEVPTILMIAIVLLVVLGPYYL